LRVSFNVENADLPCRNGYRHTWLRFGACPLLRPKCLVYIPLLQNLFENVGVKLLQPAIDIFTGEIVDQKYRAVLVGGFQGDMVPVREGIQSMKGCFSKPNSGPLGIFN
jgi:hypothetical protein